MNIKNLYTHALDTNLDLSYRYEIVREMKAMSKRHRDYWNSFKTFKEV